MLGYLEVDFDDVSDANYFEGTLHDAIVGWLAVEISKRIGEPNVLTGVRTVKLGRMQSHSSQGAGLAVLEVEAASADLDWKQTEREIHNMIDVMISERTVGEFLAEIATRVQTPY